MQINPKLLQIHLQQVTLSRCLQHSSSQRMTGNFNLKRSLGEVRTLPSPQDIQWQSVTSPSHIRGVFLVLLNILAVALLIFFTTPAAMINALTFGGGLDSVLGVEWMKNGEFVKFLFQSLVPALIIIGINAVLQQLIKLIVRLELHYRFSRHHSRELALLFVYFLFNMLIVPGVAGTVLTSLYDVIDKGSQDFNDLLRMLFKIEEGNLFLVLLLEDAGINFLVGIISIQQLTADYFSPSMCVIMKHFKIKYEHWLRQRSDLMDYGPYYAELLVEIGIAFVFQ